MPSKGKILSFAFLLLFFPTISPKTETWKELLDRADSLSKEAEYDSAIVLGTAAQGLAEKELGSENTTVALILSRLGIYHYNKGDYDESKLLHNEALAIRQKALGPDHPDVASSLSGLASAYWSQGKYPEAESLYKQALQIREKAYGPDHPDVASSQSGLAIVLWARGRYPEAESLEKRALATREKALGPNHPDVAWSLYHLAYIYEAQDRYTEEELLEKRTLSIWEKAFGPHHPYVAGSLSGLANAYQAEGKYADAESLYKRALVIQESVNGPNHSYVAGLLNALGNVSLAQGKYPGAELFHKRALAVWEKALGPDHPHVAYSLGNLANVYWAQGRYPEAESLWRQALVIMEKAYGPDHPDLASALDALAGGYRRQGKYPEAESLLKLAVTIRNKAYGPDNSFAALSLNCLAEVYQEQGKYQEAESLYDRALAIREKALGPGHEYLAVSLNGLANVYRAQGKYPVAESLYRLALALSEKALGPDHPQIAEYLESYSRCDRSSGKDNQAMANSLQAFNIRLKNFRKGASYMSERDALAYSRSMRNSLDNYLSTFLAGGSKDDKMIVPTADAIVSSQGQVSDDIFERRRSRVTETDSSVLALAESLRLTEFQLSRLFISGPGDDTTAAYRHKLDSLSMSANELEADLAQQSVSFRKQMDYKNVSSERIASLLPEKSVLVEFLKYDYLQLKPDSIIPRYLALILDNADQPDIIDLGDASAIDPLIDKYRAHMLRVSYQEYMPLKKDKEEYERICKPLYETIWKPVESKITGKELVFITPDGGLNLVSFAGLMDGNRNYLVEKYALQNLSSGRDLIRLQEQPKETEGLFALGDPDYDASPQARLTPEEKIQLASISESDKYVARNIRSGCEDLRELNVGRLPGTRKEIEQIILSWQQSNPTQAVSYFGSNASEENFKANAPGKQAIHLATHGYFLEGRCGNMSSKRSIGNLSGYAGENPLLQSGLLLAGANLHGDGADRVGVEDGILTAEEVSGMNLEGIRLVVLSACETGLGEVKSGEGVYGLRRAFLMAGARTVVSALWPVSDKTTAEMMGQLYGRSGKPLSERIRQMQLSQIRKLRKEGLADHPYNWAGFVALGDWR